jgi:hypothetical protein
MKNKRSLKLVIADALLKFAYNAESYSIRYYGVDSPVTYEDYLHYSDAKKAFNKLNCELFHVELVIHDNDGYTRTLLLKEFEI